MQREQSRQKAERLLGALATAYEATDPHRAEELLRRRLGMNRAHEEGHRELMRLYARIGERRLALEQYRLCREALRAELEAEPEAETRALYEQLAAAPELAVAAPMDSLPWPLGRRQWLRWMWPQQSLNMPGPNCAIFWGASTPFFY